jgi:branched-chain amino acid transport system ATP-binding protein
VAPVLTLRKVDKSFGGLRAVNAVSFQVEEKQIFGLIGPNGAGKTTLFNCITGHYQPSAGEVQFMAQSTLGKKPHQIALAGIARTFQNVRLFGQMSVLENVMVAAHHTTRSGVLGAMLRTRAHLDDELRLKRRAHELLELFELSAPHSPTACSVDWRSRAR